MRDTVDIIEGFHQLAQRQLQLAGLATSTAVAAMHDALADFAITQVELVERNELSISTLV